MNQGKILKYSASAGSGKTHTLTGEYLLRLFSTPVYYRRILAVTFTNKAAAGMKSRILDELHSIASGADSGILPWLERELSIPAARVRTMAADILSSILSDYSRFSVGTIDSFFQRVFRAFAREIGMQSNFSLYLDFSLLLRDAVDELLSKLNDNEKLIRWLVRYAATLFEAGNRIDLSASIFDLSRTIFSEQYKLLPYELKEQLSDLDRIEKFVSDMELLSCDFRARLRKLGENGVNILDRNGVNDGMLRGGRSGTGRYLRIIATGEIKEPYKQVIKALEEDKWYISSEKHVSVDAALSEGLRDVVSSVVNMMGEDYSGYLTVQIILRNIYMAAILTDVLKILRERANADNSFVLADTGDLLLQVTGNDQTPFIYEKTGNEYDLFMIDEFQDTSMIQYLNFKPLLENSLAQGNDTLVVGDIKQSIYRWRNGDWSILGRLLEQDFGSERIEPRTLTTNWRSLPEIVQFNNSLFRVLPGLLDADLDIAAGDAVNRETEVPFTLSEIYRDVRQTVPEGKEGGYVRIQYVEPDDDEKAESLILEEIPGIIMRCQDDGYSASDIGILVRTRNEGIRVLDHINHYRESMPDENAARYNFNVLSGESLLVGSSPAVRFIVAVMTWLIDSTNRLNRSQMIRYYLLATRPDETDTANLSLSDLDNAESVIYPEGFRKFLATAVNKPLFKLSEEIIDFFGLNGSETDIPSLNFFQDQVLEFMVRRGSSLRAFTEWWLDQGKDSSVVLSGDQDAIGIMTIHKAKGLQFKIVIVPFISWGFDQKPGNLIWVTPGTMPFSEAGAFPVGYQKNLEPTMFRSDYYRERSLSYLDNLNLLYVAFTRAEERLYGFSFCGSSKNAGAILKEGLKAEIPPEEGVISLKSCFNDTDGIFESGKPARNRDGKASDTLVAAEYPVFDIDNSLKLKLYGSDMLREGSRNIRTKINYGMVLHEILGRIKNRQDVETAVSSAITDGFVPESEAEEIRNLLINMVSRPDTADWFDIDSVILTEPEILTGAGDIRRPDRVVISGGKVTIIDYKFGMERSEHRRQMENYRNLLEDMGYTIDAACLWYVGSDKIVVI